jgi:hypothetical protein
MATKTKSSSRTKTPTKTKSSKSSASGRSSASKAKANVTTDHEEIRKWAEARGGKPACVKGTGGRGDTGLLRIEFPARGRDENLQEISWDEFFKKFDDQGLAFLYQERTASGRPSRFNKLVSRETADKIGTGRSSSRSSHGRSAR